jgi:hypothetical protein
LLWGPSIVSFFSFVPQQGSTNQYQVPVLVNAIYAAV